MNIVLTGFMASGKTAISKAIAKISDLKFLDTDDLIVERSGMTIEEIFDNMGEIGFREIEYNIIREISELDGYVISTGGGVPLNIANIRELRKNGIIVNLSADFEVIKERILRSGQKEKRPLIRSSNFDEIEQRFNDRIKYYRECDFQIRVTNDRDPDYYANEILSYL